MHNPSLLPDSFSAASQPENCREAQRMAPASALFIAFLALFAAACSRTEQTEPRSQEECPSKWAATDLGDIRASLPTDSGMHGIWDPNAFKDLCSFEAWEKTFVNDPDIEASIKTGSFVPIYVHSDGTPLINVRIGRNESMATLTPAETQHVRNESDPFLFLSTGTLAVSGIEYIGGRGPTTARMTPLESGRWSVRVFDLAAPEGPDGKPLPEIPDFVVLVNPESSPALKYRESVETFR